MDDCQLEEYKTTRHKLGSNKNFPCNKCMFTASSSYILIKHKKTEHVNEYPCDLCDFVATSEELLEEHKVNECVLCCGSEFTLLSAGFDPHITNCLDPIVTNQSRIYQNIRFSLNYFLYL